MREGGQELNGWIRRALSLFETVYICCDALDEIPDSSQARIFDILRLLADAGVRLFITSRDNRWEKQLFESLNATRIRVADYHLEAIRLYVQPEVMRSERLKSRPGLQAEIIEKVVEKSDGS